MNPRIVAFFLALTLFAVPAFANGILDGEYQGIIAKDGECATPQDLNASNAYMKIEGNRFLLVVGGEKVFDTTLTPGRLTEDFNVFASTPAYKEPFMFSAVIIKGKRITLFTTKVSNGCVRTIAFKKAEAY